MSGELCLHRVKTMTHKVLRWFEGSPNAYQVHTIELVFEDGESFDIKLFTTDLSVMIEELPSRSIEPQNVTECSICRRVHGPEVTHESE